MEAIQRELERANANIKDLQQDIKNGAKKDDQNQLQEELSEVKSKIKQFESKLNQISTIGSESRQEMQPFEIEEMKEKQQMRTKYLLPDDEEIVKIDMRSEDVQLVGKAGLEIQAKSKQALKRIIKRTHQATELAQEEEIELQKQNERLMKIDTQLDKVEATGARAMKLVRYFSKTFMTDKFIICMIFLIAIAIIVIVVLLVALGDNNTQKYYYIKK